MKTDSIRLLLALCVLALISGGAYIWNEFSASPLERYANQVIRTCAASSYPPSCYDTEIPKLMDQGLSMEDAFTVTSYVQEKKENYYYCHVLGHNLAARETVKDPSKWTEVVARCPTNVCSNGCLHGAAQERFRADALSDAEIDSLIPSLSQACEPGAVRNFTGLEQASCYHSLGHLSMYISGGDPTKATQVCDKVAKKGEADFTRVCYEGTYMQVFQTLEPEDVALVQHLAATTTTGAKALCDSFTGARRAACHRESWPLYEAQFAESGGLETFCALVPEEADRCYASMFYILTSTLNFDESKVDAMCTNAPNDRKELCFANAALRFLETDARLLPGAVAICKDAEDKNVGGGCYDTLVHHAAYTFRTDSKEFTALCTALPEPWKSRCLEG